MLVMINKGDHRSSLLFSSHQHVSADPCLLLLTEGCKFLNSNPVIFPHFFLYFILLKKGIVNMSPFRSKELFSFLQAEIQISSMKFGMEDLSPQHL